MGSGPGGAQLPARALRRHASVPPRRRCLDLPSAAPLASQRGAKVPQSVREVPQGQHARRNKQRAHRARQQQQVCQRTR